ncbi:MAG: FG-GAP-like repeat-containing protein [Cyclobacteriaceae bacterium]
MKFLVMFVLMSLLSGFSTAQIPIFRPKSNVIGIANVETFAPYYGHGASASDYDQDGDIDFYLGTMSNSPNRLYQNNGDGSYEEIAQEVGLDLTHATRASLWIDYDGDSLLDLIAISEQYLEEDRRLTLIINLMRQLSDGSFEDVTISSGLDFGTRFTNMENAAVGGVTAGDLNNDHWLDLVISVWGGGLIVFFNNGDGTFQNGTDKSNIGRSFTTYWQPILHDFDENGFIDIYCNIDFGKNELWLNQGGETFDEAGAITNSDSDFNEMGAALGDFDNDGDFDIYATNITRNWGGKFFHNVLLQNNLQDGVLTFEDVSGSHDVFAGGWDWGCTFFDFNNDGWLDLASTNGWHDTKNWEPDHSKLWVNKLGSLFDVSAESLFNDDLDAGTLIAFDADRDGDLDLLQTLRANVGTKSPVIQYENSLDLLDAGCYLVVKPRMNGANHFAIGAIVRVKTVEGIQSRLISAGTSFYGQEPAEAFFGLGDNTLVESVTIQWPGGRTSVYESIESNQVILLRDETIETPTDLSSSTVDGNTTIYWKDNSDNEDQFVIQFAKSLAFEDVDEFKVDMNLTSFQLPGSQGGFIRIKAVNQNVSSTYSKELFLEGVLGFSSSSNSKIMMYPNPVRQYEELTFKYGQDEPLRVDMCDLLSHKVAGYKFVGDADEYKVRINLASGVYMMIMTQGENEYVERLIVK